MFKIKILNRIVLTASLAIVSGLLGLTIFISYKTVQIKNTNSVFSERVGKIEAVQLPVQACKNANSYQIKLKCILEETGFERYLPTEAQESFEASLLALGGLGASQESILAEMNFNSYKSDGTMSQVDFVNDLLVDRINVCYAITEKPCVIVINGSWPDYFSNPSAYISALSELTEIIDETINQ